MSTTEQLLRILESRRGDSISGEELAGALGITRAAVWKHIKKLRDDGYIINGVKNSGYCLAKEDDRLSAEGIRPFLNDPAVADRVFVYDVLDSTNTEAKRRVLDGAEQGTVVIARRQTAGKGRLGRSFYSPEDKGIYLTVILRPKLSTPQAVSVTAVASVAVARAIEKVMGKSTDIKWVNDVYLHGKKICGILSEAVTDLESGRIEGIVVGIGINCTTVFPDELGKVAGSIVEENDSAAVRNQIAAEVINQMLDAEEMIKTGSYLEEYRRRSMVLGKQITILQEHGSCYTAKDIGRNGELILVSADGAERILSSGEVSIRLAE